MNATFWRDTRILGYVYAALFAWAVVRAVYQDHIYFVNYTKSKESQRLSRIFGRIFNKNYWMRRSLNCKLSVLVLRLL